MHLFEPKKFAYNFYFIFRDAILDIDLTGVPGAPFGDSEEVILDLLVENMGRANYGRPHEFMQKKGLWEGPVLLDGQELKDWEIVPLEFKKKGVNRYL